jgi:hypothetical protein
LIVGFYGAIALSLLLMIMVVANLQGAIAPDRFDVGVGLSMLEMDA